MTALPLLAAILGTQPMTSDASSLAPSMPALMPRPQEIHVWNGVGFTFDTKSRVYVAGAPGAANRLREMLLRAASLDLKETKNRFDVGKPGVVAFLPAMPGDGVKPEGYRLIVKSGGLSIISTDEAGAFYAVQTIRQLLPNAIESDRTVKGTRWTVPAVEILDWPRFRWRGMHLDVSRHFFPPAFIKRYIDFIALHKMNRFHWHLVDDGGWRMEVKKYPKLTALGAWRTDTGEVWPGGAWNFGSLEFPGKGSGKKLYGGFYSQDEIRDIVKFADERHVVVVPEIEMPGHNLPALVSYPEVGCENAGPSQGIPRTNVFCAGNDATLTFLEDVLKETMDLFPSPWIHVGADEVWKGWWQKCPKCQARIAAEGLKGDTAAERGYRPDHSAEDNLQSWFVRHFENFLWRNGRRLIGWDEILEGGLAPGATVMSWRGIDGGVAAAKSGHEAIMSPGTHCYFDHPYSSTDTRKVHGWEPIPEELNGVEAKFILGGQANVWTEWIPTEERTEYMIFPRMLAMAEVLWLDKGARDWDGFAARLGPYFGRLDVLRATYQMPAPEVAQGALIFDDFAEVAAKPVPGIPFTLRFTTDGSAPTSASPKYAGSIRVTSDSVVVFAYVNAQGKSGDAARVECRKFAPVSGRTGLSSGLLVEAFDGDFSSIPDFSKLKASSSGIASTISADSLPGKAHEYALRFTGFFDAPADGVYAFTIGSDDGATLRLAEAMLVNNDGLHGYAEKSASIYLKKGLYPLEIGYFEQRGAKGLKVFVEGPRISRTELGGERILSKR